MKIPFKTLIEPRKWLLSVNVLVYQFVLELCMSSVEPIMFAGTKVLSLRQLDELNNLPKGSSFRCFKICEKNLVEGKDFYYLSADNHAEFIEQLRMAEQIYVSTRHLLLLTRSGYQCLRERFRAEHVRKP